MKREFKIVGNPFGYHVYEKHKFMFFKYWRLYVASQYFLATPIWYFLTFEDAHDAMSKKIALENRINAFSEDVAYFSLSHNGSNKLLRQVDKRFKVFT